MKKNIETWINPKTKKREKIEVREYSFEDWDNGLISGNWKAGKELGKIASTNKYFYTLIPESEYSKIEEKQKEIYFTKVMRNTESYISGFKKKYEMSEAKDRLLRTEIDRYEKLLFPEKFPIRTLNNTHFPLGKMGFPTFDSITISGIRELYQEIIVKGEKNFALTKSANGGVQVGAGDFHFVRVEAIAKYYNYLLQLEITLSQQKESADKPTKPELQITFSETKSFPDYLLHIKREELAKSLKAEFSTEKGKGIRLMIEALQMNEPTLLSIENRKRSATYKALKSYFKRDIGTYQAIFSYKFEKSKDKPDFDSVCTRLKLIMQTVNKEK